MNKDAYYFPHFSNARKDRRIQRLRMQLGVEGYGIYFMILEVLREEKDYSYPVSDIDLLARDFETSSEKVKAVVYNYDLFEVDDNNFFFSVRFIEYLKPYLQTKHNRKIAGIKGNLIKYGYCTKDELDKLSDTEIMQLNDDKECLNLAKRSLSDGTAITNRSQIVAKESKVKKSKVKESKVNTYTHSDDETECNTEVDLYDNNYNIIYNNINKKEKVLDKSNTTKKKEIAYASSSKLDGVLDSSFNIFWDIYDKKVETKKCKEKWYKLNDSDREKILATVQHYVNYYNDKQYRKNPSTYLNNHCWEDEIPTKETKTISGSSIVELNEKNAYNHIVTVINNKKLIREDNKKYGKDYIVEKLKIMCKRFVEKYNNANISNWNSLIEKWLDKEILSLVN